MDLSQPDLAARAGITTAQLANIESGRVPLRFATAWTLCKCMNMHPGWLATGFNESRGFNFSDETAAWMDRVANGNEDAHFRDSWVSISWIFGESESAQSVLAELIKTDHILSFPASPKKNNLTRLYALVNLPIVKRQLPDQMPDLLRRIKAVTMEKGKKTELAEAVGVPLASLSQWLSGDREPGGEYTLKIERWVELQESISNSASEVGSTTSKHRSRNPGHTRLVKQKRPGSADNTTRAKAQSERRYEQPNTSGPPKQ